VKSAKNYSLRTAQAIARVGKAARHPLCLAALDLWATNAKCSKLTKDALSTKELLNRAKRQKKQARALLDHFYKEGKRRESIEAAAHCRKTNENLQKAREAYEVQVKVRQIFDEILTNRIGQFGRELLAAERAKKQAKDPAPFPFERSPMRMVLLSSWRVEPTKLPANQFTQQKEQD
jgi:hypothetical protein